MASQSTLKEPRFILSQAGQSLIQVLVGVGIMGVMMAAFAVITESQQKETRALAEKLASTELTRVMTLVLGQASTCDLLFTKPGNVVSGSSLTFDPAAVTYPFVINLQSVPQSSSGENVVSLTNPVVSDISRTLKVQASTGIQVQVTSATTGNLLINFDQAGLVRPIKNLSFPISIATTPAGSSQQIVGCKKSGSGSCPANQFMTGLNPDGSPVCTANGSQLGTPCQWKLIADAGSRSPGSVLLTYEGVTARDQNGTRCCMVAHISPDYPVPGGGACYYF